MVALSVRSTTSIAALNSAEWTAQYERGHQLDLSKPPSVTTHPDRDHKTEIMLGRLHFDFPALPPLAGTRFCLRYPNDCAASNDVSSRRPIRLTRELWIGLIKINRDVNQTITPGPADAAILEQQWQLYPKTGVCNDYAVTKRHELLRLGWPASALLLSEVAISLGEHHLVLVVRTLEGDLVLDNLDDNVRAIDSVPYVWIRAQSPNDPNFWSTVSLMDARVNRRS